MTCPTNTGTLRNRQQGRKSTEKALAKSPANLVFRVNFLTEAPPRKPSHAPTTVHCVTVYSHKRDIVTHNRGGASKSKRGLGACGGGRQGRGDGLHLFVRCSSVRLIGHWLSAFYHRNSFEYFLSHSLNIVANHMQHAHVRRVHVCKM